MPARPSRYPFERFFSDPGVGDGVMRPGMSGLACENIRSALGMLGYDVEYGDQYDATLARTVQRFQADAGHTNRDGVVGPGTRKLLASKLIEKHGPTIYKRLRDPEGGGYIFVSYRREDMSRITGTLDSIAGWGFRVWYDKQGIPGGAEFDALIEERVAGCALLLVFISEAAVESKWVRREVKFADHCEKPILAVTLEEAELTHGLNMLLSGREMLDASEPSFLTELKKAIEYATTSEPGLL
jgi:hypothetical protein